MQSVCVKCGSDLKIPKTGRKPRYCGPACRRAAEYELRRVQRTLENLESWERGYRQDLDEGYPSTGPNLAYTRKKHAWYTAEIARTEARMRELCDTNEMAE